MGEQFDVFFREELLHNLRGVEQLDLFFLEELLHNLRGVDWGVVPVEKPLPLHSLWPLLPQILQEGPQGSDDVFRVDSVPPGEVFCVHHTLGVKDRQDHGLRPGGIVPRLHRARSALF